MAKYFKIFLLLSLIFTSRQAFSWEYSNSFKFVNEFDVPIILSFDSTRGAIRPDGQCANPNQIKDIVVLPHSKSCSYNLVAQTSVAPWYSSPHNSGKIRFFMQNDPQSFCQLEYEYTYDAKESELKKISQNFKNLVCANQLSEKEVAVDNPRMEAVSRPISGILPVTAAVEDIARGNCGGARNCIIVSPDINRVYHFNDGSSLSESLALQRQLQQYEPLNFEQFLGTHNSTISQKYMNSTTILNLSYGDPNQVIGMTEQLNLGVRQIELDFLWNNKENQVQICHNHVQKYVGNIICDGSVSLASAILELKAWLDLHPNEFVMLFFDINQQPMGHVNDLQAAIEPIYDQILKPSDLGVTNDAFPMSGHSVSDFISKYKRSVVLFAEDKEYGDTLPIFYGVENSSTWPLTQEPQDDKNHVNIWRTLESRTIIDYLVYGGGGYTTAEYIRANLSTPKNLYSIDMLNATCNFNLDCAKPVTDSRLFAFAWAWQRGYPRQSLQAGNWALIHPETHQFLNEPINSNQQYSVLCFTGIGNTKGPTEPSQWNIVENYQFASDADIEQQAQATCRNVGGVFAVPTTSYWMADVFSQTQTKTKQLILSNYKRTENTWIPNNGQSLLKKL